MIEDGTVDFTINIKSTIVEGFIYSTSSISNIGRYCFVSFRAKYDIWRKQTVIFEGSCEPLNDVYLETSSCGQLTLVIINQCHVKYFKEPIQNIEVLNRLVFNYSVLQQY